MVAHRSIPCAHPQRAAGAGRHAVYHAFRFLFGTATDDEVAIENIKYAVYALAESQGCMVTLMKKFTTVVNFTYNEIQANCNQINRLTAHVQSLTAQLNSELSFLHQCLWVQERRMDIEFVLQSHEAFLHRKENLEAGRLTENILPHEVLKSILSNSDDGSTQMISPLQWYYENTAVVPIWFDHCLVYRAKLPLVGSTEWHHVIIRCWPMPLGDWEATVLLPGVVLKDKRTGVLNVSPNCYRQ